MIERQKYRKFAGSARIYRLNHAGYASSSSAALLLARVRKYTLVNFAERYAMRSNAHADRWQTSGTRNSLIDKRVVQSVYGDMEKDQGEIGFSVYRKRVEL